MTLPHHSRLCTLLGLLTLLTIIALPLTGNANAAEKEALERPNILWLVSEDNSTYWVSCYGSPNATASARHQRHFMLQSRIHCNLH